MQTCTKFRQISCHTFFVVQADVLADVLNLIRCAHYNSSNVRVLFDAGRSEIFRIYFRIIVRYAHTKQAFI
jgi:hypothetical protein